jgi:hypothetical protein
MKSISPYTREKDRVKRGGGGDHANPKREKRGKGPQNQHGRGGLPHRTHADDERQSRKGWAREEGRERGSKGK